MLHLLIIPLFTLALATSGTIAAAASYATDWVAGHNSRARLIVGGAPSASGTIQRYVALELALMPGWKTYWRQPGTAGGIPPQIESEGSANLRSATLHYPAPVRMVDPSGASIGYKKSVVFPLAIEPEDPARPMVLNINAFFGVCREICIPAEAAFRVTVTPDLFRQTPPELAKALASLPAGAAEEAVNAPTLSSVKAAKSATGQQALIFEIRYPGGTDGADLFAETGDHQPLDMSETVARPSSDTIRYQVIVEDAALWQSLAKTGIVATMVSAAGAREVRLPRP